MHNDTNTFFLFSADYLNDSCVLLSLPLPQGCKVHLFHLVDTSPQAEHSKVRREWKMLEMSPSWKTFSPAAFFAQRYNIF